MSLWRALDRTARDPAAHVSVMADALARKMPVGVPWKPGQSGNPGGRPKGYKGFAKEIQAEAKPGELVKFLYEIFRGTHELGSTLQARQWAWEQIINRGWGKAPSVVEVHNLDSDPVATMVDVSAMSTEDLEACEKAAEIFERYANKRKSIDV